MQTIMVDNVTAAGGTAEEWSDGDLTTVRGAERLREWIVVKSPRVVWFCCPIENSTPSESCHLTAVQSRPRHQSREHRIQRHMCNLAADMASSGQCDFVLEIPWNSRAVRPGGCIFERLKGFHRAWVPACAWGLRTDSGGYAEGGWRAVTSMRLVADLFATRSCNEAHWHRTVERVFPPAATLPHLCRRLMPTFLQRRNPMELAELVAGATIRRRLRGKESIHCTSISHTTIHCATVIDVAAINNTTDRLIITERCTSRANVSVSSNEASFGTNSSAGVEANESW